MLGRANCELLTPAIKECRLVSVCPPTARPPPITCTRQPRRAPFSGRLAHSLCATNLNCKASRSYVSHTYFFQERLGSYWHKCEVPTGPGNVCCLGQTGHTADITKPTRLTQPGHQDCRAKRHIWQGTNVRCFSVGTHRRPHARRT